MENLSPNLAKKSIFTHLDGGKSSFQRGKSLLKKLEIKYVDIKYKIKYN